MEIFIDIDIEQQEIKKGEFDFGARRKKLKQIIN